MKMTDRAGDIKVMLLLAAACAAAGKYFALPELYPAAVLLALAGLLLPGLSAAIAGGWLKFGAFLGRINFRVLMTLFFYLVLTPAGLLHRLFAGDTLRLRRPAPGESLFRRRDKEFSAADLENPW